MSLSVYVTGLLAGLSLIVAIGAQNAFVMRQGLMGEHVFAVALACSLSDAALIALGVTSFRQIAGVAPAAPHS
jgi:L-lysine exporter family protein LysE/ArgO